MHTGRNKFRKRQRQTPQDKSQRTAILRQIGEDFQKRKFALGLAKANAALAASSATGPEQAQVLSLVADSEFKRGRFREAAHIHLQAGSRSVSHPTLWLRAHIGQVRALLKVPQVDQAVIMARHAVAVAEAKMSQFNDKVSAANKEFHKKGTVLVPWVPPRVSVVATRMGYLFLQEGEPEAAEELFEKAIQSCKGGANRARQGLAQIALAKGEYGKARNISVDAIRRGGFKAKTLSSWITLIAAGRQLPERRISDRLINGLCVAPAGLRARTILTIVRELRKSDMYQWREITEQWSSREGAHFPIIEVEIRKLILASEKRKLGNTTERKTAAERLLKSPGLSPNEWLSAAKELVQSSLREGEQINISQLLSKAGDLYGKEYSFMAAHSLALSCMMAKRHDLARSILQANIQRVARDQKIWGKSIWALARMESLLGDHGAAAVLFRQFFEEASTPVRFRLQAQLLWCQELIASGHMDALLEVRSLMTRTLGNVEDPEILMN